MRSDGRKGSLHAGFWGMVDPSFYMFYMFCMLLRRLARQNRSASPPRTGTAVSALSTATLAAIRASAVRGMPSRHASRTR